MERENEEEKRKWCREGERWQPGNGYTVVSLNCMLPLAFTLFKWVHIIKKLGKLRVKRLDGYIWRYCADRLFCVSMCMGGVNVYMYVCVYFLCVCISTKAGDGRPTSLIFKALWKDLNTHTDRALLYLKWEAIMSEYIQYTVIHTPGPTFPAPPPWLFLQVIFHLFHSHYINVTQKRRNFQIYGCAAKSQLTLLTARLLQVATF